MFHKYWIMDFYFYFHIEFIQIDNHFLINHKNNLFYIIELLALVARCLYQMLKNCVFNKSSQWKRRKPIWYVWSQKRQFLSLLIARKKSNWSPHHTEARRLTGQATVWPCTQGICMAGVFFSKGYQPFWNVTPLFVCKSKSLVILTQFNFLYWHLFLKRLRV